MSTNLASLLLIEQLQPATAALLSATNRIGATLEAGKALLLFEVQPTGAIDTVCDIVFKDIDAEPAIFQLDGRVAYLGITSDSISELRNVAHNVMETLGVALPDGAGKLVSTTKVSNISAPHAKLTGLAARNEAVKAGDTLLTLECLPAPLAIRAMNEAEKATDFAAVDMRFTGSMGRFKLAGNDDVIRIAQDAALSAIEEGL